jgi:hypothetical protein
MPYEATSLSMWLLDKSCVYSQTFTHYIYLSSTTHVVICRCPCIGGWECVLAWRLQEA